MTLLIEERIGWEGAGRCEALHCGAFWICSVSGHDVDTSPGDPILMGTFGIDYSGPVDLIVSGAPASNFEIRAGPLPNNSPPGTVLFHVPEPGAAALLGVGLAALVVMHRSRAEGR